MFHGKLVYRASAVPGDACAVDSQITPFATAGVDEPLAMIPTEYHFLLLFQGIYFFCSFI